MKLFCRHNYIKQKKIGDYFDYIGFHFEVYTCKCSKCGKIKKRRYLYGLQKGEDMKFELGKTYKHDSGKKMKIVGYALTHIYGECYVGENESGELIPVGKEEDNTVGWEEINV